MTIATDDFWHFSLKLYQIEQVKDTLLQAQDKLGLNVNLALFCLYLNQQGIFSTTEQMAQLATELNAFNQEFTQKLRALRLDFRIKQQQLDSYEEIKKALLTAELLLEQQEQKLIVNIAEQWQTFSGEHCDNLMLYQSLLASQKIEKTKSTLKLSDLNQYIH